jgi:arylamine N-acetyltransferase
MSFPIKLFDKYIEILGIEPAEPSYDLLRKIVKAHLIKIPFENISKLLQKNKGTDYIPDLSEYLNGIEKYNFGGTCYANNFYLYTLLEYLQFNVKLCGADMKTPDVHLISMISIGECEYIADAGYAAPFFNPLPRHLRKSFIILFGNEKYIVKPKDKMGNTKIEQYDGGKLQHWYTAKPQPRKIEDFRKVICESYSDEATFMNALRIVRFSENGSLSLRNLSLTETIASKSSTIEIPWDQLPAVVNEKFSIPRELVEQSLCRIKKFRDLYN